MMVIDIDLLLDVIAKVCAAGIVMIIAYLAPKVKAWLVQQIGETEEARLEATIKTLVEAAEQMLKEDDPTGEKRKAYVEEQLQRLSIPVNDFVNALIEQAVRNINTWDI